MPARDTYKILLTVQGEYEDEPRTLLKAEDYLAPNQDESVVAASLLRNYALLFGMEDDDERSLEAIYKVLDSHRAALPSAIDVPNTRRLLMTQLWSIAEALGLEWYGAKK